MVRKVKAEATTLGLQVRRAIVATTTPPRVAGKEANREALREMIAGAAQRVEWGSKGGKHSREQAEKHMRGAQVCAARMLQRWAMMVREATPWAHRREKGRARMGTVLWAWRCVVKRRKGRQIQDQSQT